MTVYSGPVFDMAVNQFNVIANHLEIPMDERDRILMPKRAVTVSCPIHRDDGTVAVFEGYRVQHHLTLGPTKGGTRFAPTVDIGEVAALAIWMSWKCALAGLPYGGAKGGVNVDLSTISKRELEALSRRYMQEMIPFVGPHTDVMAPDMGTNEQVMAWFMDTYSMYQGRTVTEIVTGKPVASGGTLGRREATGRGVAYLARRVMKELSINPGSGTAVIQGFGNVGSYAALELHQYGLKVIAVSDHTGALHDANGLDIPALMRHAGAHGSIAGFSNQLHFDPEQILTLPCDGAGAGGDGARDRRKGRGKPEMPHSCGRRQRPDHAGRRPRAGQAARRGFRHSRHPLQFRRRGGQLFRMGAGSAAIVLGGRGGDDARIQDPRPRLRHRW